VIADHRSTILKTATEFARIAERNTDMKDITKNKHGGNAQSNAAFEKIEKTLTHRQNDVLWAIDWLHQLSKEGVISRDIAWKLNAPLNAISGRITELKAMGKIKQIGRRDGCAVYTISPTSVG